MNKISLLFQIVVNFYKGYMFALQFIGSATEFLRILAERYEYILYEINEDLVEQGYSPYYQSNLMFNTDYRLRYPEDKPRFVYKFPFGAKLDTFYLYHIPSQKQLTIKLN